MFEFKTASCSTHATIRTSLAQPLRILRTSGGGSRASSIAFATLCDRLVISGWRQAITSTRAVYLNKVRLDLNWSDCLKTSPRPSFVPDPLIPDPSKSDLWEVLVLAEGDVAGPAEHEVFWVPLDELEGLAAADDLHRDAVPPQELAANGHLMEVACPLQHHSEEC